MQKGNGGSIVVRTQKKESRNIKVKTVNGEREVRKMKRVQYDRCNTRGMNGKKRTFNEEFEKATIEVIEITKTKAIGKGRDIQK